MFHLRAPNIWGLILLWCAAESPAHLLASLCPQLPDAGWSVWPQSAWAVDLISAVGISKEPWWWVGSACSLWSSQWVWQIQAEKTTKAGREGANKEWERRYNLTLNTFPLGEPQLQSKRDSNDSTSMFPHYPASLSTAICSITYQQRIIQTIIRRFKDKSISNSRT